MTWQAGDVVFANLDPVRGTEQRGSRPVIVISVASLGPRVIVVPMTTTIRRWPTRIAVELHGIQSEAMCDQVRTIDMDRLDEQLYGRISARTTADIQRTVARLIGVYI